MDEYRKNGFYVTRETINELMRLLAPLEFTPFTAEDAKGFQTFRVPSMEDMRPNGSILYDAERMPTEAKARTYTFERKKVCFDIWLCRGEG